MDTAKPAWDEELVDIVGDVRLDFMQIVLNGNGIPTLSYTTPDVEPAPSPAPLREVTTASRKTVLPLPSPPPARLLNISTRARVQTQDDVLIGGFIVTGSGPRKMVIRALGPSLQVDGTPVPGRLANPTLELFQQGNPVPIDSNDNWKENEAAVEATTLAPPNDLEAVIVRTLNPGAYTAIVRGQNRGTGIGLAEVYDLSAEVASELANLSSRGFVETGDNVMIGGFIVGPASAGGAKIVVRGIGPSLQKQLPAALEDTTLELRDKNGAQIGSNDDWQQSPRASEIQTAGLAPENSAESAILLPAVAPGAYTAILRGKGGETGIGLVEIYNVR